VLKYFKLVIFFTICQFFFFYQNNIAFVLDYKHLFKNGIVHKYKHLYKGMFIIIFSNSPLINTKQMTTTHNLTHIFQQIYFDRLQFTWTQPNLYESYIIC